MEHISNEQLWELPGWIVLISLMPLISRVMQDQRRSAFEKVAMAMGFGFEADGRTLPQEITASLAMFRTGVYIGPEHYQDHIKQAGDISSALGGARA